MPTKREIEDFQNKRKADCEVKEEKLCAKKRKRGRPKKRYFFQDRLTFDWNTKI